MKKLDPMSLAIFGMLISFFVSLAACETRPKKAQLKPLRADQVAQQIDFKSMPFAQLDAKFSEQVEKTWNDMLGAKLGLQDVAQDLVGLEMIRQYNQYKILLTTRSAGECAFTGFKDSNEQGSQWLSGIGSMQTCQKYQIQAEKHGDRYILNMKGFAGFQLPVRALIVESVYEKKDLYAYSVQAHHSYYKNLGENYLQKFMADGPMSVRISKVYLPVALQSNPIKGFVMIHKHFNYFSHQRVLENSIVPIEWAINIDLVKRSTASSNITSARINKMQLHFYGNDPMSLIDNKQDLWVKFGSTGGFNAVLAYKPKANQ